MHTIKNISRKGQVLTSPCFHQLVFMKSRDRFIASLSAIETLGGCDESVPTISWEPYAIYLANWPQSVRVLQALDDARQKATSK